MTELKLIPYSSDIPAEVIDKIEELLKHSRAEKTVKTYKTAWNKWCTWAAAKGLPEFPARPEDIVLYLIDSQEQGATKATLAMFMTVQRLGHAGRIDDPTNHVIVQEAWKAARRKDKRPIKQARVLSLSELKLLCEATIEDISYPRCSYRNRALLALGWAGALRASELVALTWQDIEYTSNGIEVFIRSSKTDQEGKGYTIAIPWFSNENQVFCPCRALAEIKPDYAVTFIDIREADNIPVFRRSHSFGWGKALSTKAVSRIVQKAADLAGLPGHYSAHSLRRGLATWAASTGINDRDIMRHGRWRSREVMDGYVQQGTLWVNHLLSTLT